MTTALAIFVKTPELSPVKTRLAKDIGKESAIRLYESFVDIIENKIKCLTQDKADITPYFAIAEKEGLSNHRWQSFGKIHTGNGDLGERLHNVYSSLLKQHDEVIIIGSDSPQISSEVIIKTAALIKENNKFVIGPARDGGFYLFAGNKEIPKEVWTDVVYSKNTTMTDLVRKLEPISKIEFLETLIDIDQLDDLIFLLKENL
jgi:uncharacterized protein